MSALISLIPSLTIGTKSPILPTHFIDGKTDSELFPNLSKSYVGNTNSILTLVRLQDFNLFSDPLFYRWENRLEKMAVDLWETNQDQKPGDLASDPRGHKSLLVTFIC